MFSARIGLGFVLMSGAAVAQQYVISTVAGGAPPPTPIAAVNASFAAPWGVATDASGGVYFTSINCVFRIAQNGVLTRIAGTSRPGFSGDGGAAVSSQLNGPTGLVVDASGDIYVADTGNNRIRRISLDGLITTAVGGGRGGDNVQATEAQLNGPYGVAVDPNGSLYVADAFSNRVLKVSSVGVVTTIAGNGTPGLAGDGGQALAAQLNGPNAVPLDRAGNIYISDFKNSRIRMVSVPGVISTVAGPNIAGFSGDSGKAVAAQLQQVHGLVVDDAGNLFIADTGNSRIRKVSTDGGISTVAGGGNGGDGVAATSAFLNSPSGVAVDEKGAIYEADYLSNRIRQVSPSGVITTVAGNGRFSFSGEGVPATTAQLLYPSHVALDGSGNIYVVDSGNARVRKITSGGT
jgi:trimeric autotransporter adhesin